ncbi:unnamed protein product [Gordionus sp. m RMFG-2023]
MQSNDVKMTIRKLFLKLLSKTQVELKDEAYWEQLWTTHNIQIQDMFILFTAGELKKMKELSPYNLAALFYKNIERIYLAAKASCQNNLDQKAVLNCLKMLTRILPHIFQDEDWQDFFWSNSSKEKIISEIPLPLGKTLLTILCDLMFCPDFTVGSHKIFPEGLEDITNLDSCEYIWENGVGFSSNQNKCLKYDCNRVEILRLLLTCLSQNLYKDCVASVDCGTDTTCNEGNDLRAEETTGGYQSLELGDTAHNGCTNDLPSDDYNYNYFVEEANNFVSPAKDPWIEYFSSQANRHTLSIFTSLLNVVCDRGKECFCNQASSSHWYANLFRFGSQNKDRDVLVELCLHILLVVLSYESHSLKSLEEPETKNTENSKNLFSLYLSRLHHEEDFDFVLKGMIGLLNESLPFYNPNFSNSYNVSNVCHNPVNHTTTNGLKNGGVNGLGGILEALHLNPFSGKGAVKICQLNQEVMVLFWLFCDLNKKFVSHLMKTNKVLDIILPILYHLNESKMDESKMGIIHVGIFVLLVLSGERNLGVRLNKPYSGNLFKNEIPIITATNKLNHADILLLIFHEIIVRGHYKLSNLYESLLIIIVNISPYLKGLSMITAKKLLHLLEGFADPHFIYAKPYNYRLVFFLLETLNNLIQYQFDGNSTLVYQIIKKRKVFYNLLNLPTDQTLLNHLHDKVKEEVQDPNGIKSSKICSDNFMNNDSFYDANDAFNGNNKIKWKPNSAWASTIKQKMPLQTILRLLQVLIPQIERICIENKSNDESEILKFLHHGTLVGLLPVPHPILIRKYQTNRSTSLWFLTYIWGFIYLKNMDPPIWFETDIKLFEIKKL